MSSTRCPWIFLLLVVVPISILFLSGLKASAQESVIGPEDALTITVVDHPELGGTMMVAADGTITVPVVGQIKVVGLTISDLTKQLVAGLKQRLVAPEVYVFLAARNPQVYVIGAVMHPGMYSLVQNDRLLTLLANAGGLGQPTGATTGGVVEPPAPVGQYTAKLLRKATGQQVPVDLVKVLAGDAAANLELAEGDVLFVEQLPMLTLYVTGDVDAPGMYQLSQGSKVSQALSLARGVQGKLEDKRASILRKTQTLPVDLAQVYAPDGAGDLALQDGDVLRIESALLTVTISGEVRAAGPYPVTNGMGVTEALNLAGGTTPAALLTAISLTHLDGTQEVVNLPLAAQQGAKTILHDGDRLYVPTTLVQVVIAGEVKTPGPYAVPPEMRATDLLSLAGGPTTAAALAAVKVLHVGGTIETVDATKAKLELKDGDHVLVPTLYVGVTVLGEVKQPGLYQLSPTMTVADALSQSGGTTPAAALTAVTVVHAGGAVEMVDASTTKLTVKEGDRITVSSSFVTVSVAGEVKTPGDYQVMPQLGLANLITLAGGPTPASALAEVKVLHVGGTVETVDATKGKLDLKDGDHVLVPTLYVGVTVLGEVKQPGPYQLSPTMTVADAISQSGGNTQAAALTVVMVVHAGGAVEKVDATTTKLTVKEGDRITVPSSFVTVNVAGEVKTPGDYQVTPQIDLTDILTLAGGATPAAALSGVKIAHIGGLVEVVDVATAHPTFTDGDRILVPTSLINVTISGEVQTPGAYQFAPKTTLMDALAVAGGPTLAASVTAVKIMHLDGGIDTVDTTKGTQPLRDGDRVMVPMFLVNVTIGGEVKAPGAYQVGPRTSLADALTIAGGTTVAAATHAIKIMHVEGDADTVDAATTQITLKNGDRVLVPTSLLSVTIIGEVKEPGTYQVGPTMGVADVVAMAGGVLPTANSAAVQLAHLGGAVDVVDLDGATHPVKDGDRVLVPTWLINVAVAGEVKSPGTYQMSPTMTAADSIVMAGGTTVAAATDQVQITHLGGTMEVVDVTKVKEPLRDGDRVLVPSSLIDISVSGEVHTPGAYQLSPQMTLGDAIALAGGALPDAGLDHVQLMHVGGALEEVNIATTKPTLKEGDHITLQTALVSVTISGEVKMPGVYQVSRQMTPIDVITIAGGATPAASLGAVQVIHVGGAVETVNTNRPQVGITRPLADGDRIIVPTANDSIMIWGSIKSPGLYPIDQEHPFALSEAIIRAQGPADDSGNTVSVARIVEGKPQDRLFDINSVMVHDPKSDIALAPDDVVFVAKKKTGYTWRSALQDLIQGLTIAELMRDLK